MKYTISEENKSKTLNKNRIFQALNYGVGILVSVYVLTQKTNLFSADKNMFFLGILILAPAGWFYFDKKFKNRLNTEYIIDNEKLTIIEKGRLPKTILFNSIFSVTKISQGYRIESKSGKNYIPEIVENSAELVRELRKHIG